MDRLDAFTTQKIDPQFICDKDPKIKRLDRFHKLPPKLLSEETGGSILYCYEWSYIGANLLIEHYSDVYIIETMSHVVVYDTKNTWDFMANCLFLDYRFPNTPLSKPIKIWKNIPFGYPILEDYYKPQTLLEGLQRPICYKKVIKI